MIDHKIKATPEDIKVVGHLDFEIISVGMTIIVKEIGGGGLTTALPLDIFKDETDEVPGFKWVGRSVKLVRRKVEKEWVSWEL